MAKLKAEYGKPDTESRMRKAEYGKPNAESRMRKAEYGKLNTESRIRRVLKISVPNEGHIAAKTHSDFRF